MQRNENQEPKTMATHVRSMKVATEQLYVKYPDSEYKKVEHKNKQSNCLEVSQKP